MANKQETKKRRVAAAQQVERQRSAAAKRERRRQLVVGGVVGFLALALIAPLTAGLIVGDDDEPAAIEIPTTTTLDLRWVPAALAGASITGPTPCPATDGSAERTTSFEQPPPVCIDETAVYELTFDSSVGPVTVPVDATIDPEVTNLAAVLGWYNAYEDTPIQAFGAGLIGIGGLGDAGFVLDPRPSGIPIDTRFEPGAVLATTMIGGGLNGGLMVVVDETGAGVLEQSQVDFVRVGTIDDVAPLVEAYDALAAASAEELVLIDGVTVTETG